MSEGQSKEPCYSQINGAIVDGELVVRRLSGLRSRIRGESVDKMDGEVPVKPISLAAVLAESGAAINKNTTDALMLISDIESLLFK